jgi:formate C-acetyltransferase
MEKALKMAQKGLATPAFFNDRLVLPLVVSKGATLEEARDWSIEGCVERYVMGKTDGRPVVGYVNAVKAVELPLINGVDRETLRNAQANPKEYKNLMVRVAGCSACFIELDRDVQENIIARTLHPY